MRRPKITGDVWDNIAHSIAGVDKDARERERYVKDASMDAAQVFERAELALGNARKQLKSTQLELERARVALQRGMHDDV